MGETVSVNTTPYTLLDWLDTPRTDHAISFSKGTDDWTRHSYAELAAASRRVAAGLLARGVRRGDVVVLILRSGEPFVASLYGTMAAGATPSPVGPPSIFHDAQAYQEHLARVVAIARPTLVVTEQRIHATIASAVRRVCGAGVATVPFEELRQHEEVERQKPAEVGLLQFTSGSSGSPKGVAVPFRALQANVDSISSWLRLEPDTGSAHWLPFHHDMGLIGGLITPVTHQQRLWNLRPGDFVRSPARYLRCVSELRLEIGTMPNFGLEQVVERVGAAELEGLDLSCWRAVVIGAERLNPLVFERFTELLRPYGFRSEAMMPAYGLAEATLAVTGLALDRAPSYRTLDGAPATREDIARGDAMVGCGTPLAGTRVRVVDEDHREVPDGVAGEIVVYGDSLYAGYRTAETPGSEPSAAGLDTPGTGAPAELRTGDAGFVADGQLYVLGRFGDALKVRGVKVFAEDVEVAVCGLGIASYQVAVLLGSHEGMPVAVAVVERLDPALGDRVRARVTALTGDAHVLVIGAPPRTILRTTSGKPRRRLMWREFTEGRLGPAVPLPDLPEPSPEAVAGVSARPLGAS